MENLALIKAAAKLIHPASVDQATMGGVACLLLTVDNNLYQGVCIDTISGMGFCAEHTAFAQMITKQEYQIKKIVAVIRQGDDELHVLAPCGRCREFMYQTNNKNLATEVVLGVGQSVLLKDLLPYHDWSSVVNS